MAGPAIARFTQCLLAIPLLLYFLLFSPGRDTQVYSFSSYGSCIPLETVALFQTYQSVVQSAMLYNFRLATFCSEFVNQDEHAAMLGRMFSVVATMCLLLSLIGGLFWTLDFCYTWLSATIDTMASYSWSSSRVLRKHGRWKSRRAFPQHG